MNSPSPVIPDLQRLVTLFCPSIESVGQFEEVSAPALPPPFRRLLDHHEHMTVTLESFHQCPVAVEVKKRRLSRTHYERKSVLRKTRGGDIVQYCVVRLDLRHLEADVREEIEDEQIPLGRTLISHNVLRRVQMFALWKIVAGEDMRKVFALDKPQVTYGRTALIFCNGEPSVELLEIVAPLRS